MKESFEPPVLLPPTCSRHRCWPVPLAVWLSRRCTGVKASGQRPSSPSTCGDPTPSWIARGGRCAMPEWHIEPLSQLEQIQDVLAIEELSFTNPWTREMYVAEFDNPDVAFCYLAKNSAGE